MAGMYGCFKGRNSDGAAMASGPPDVTTNQEPAEVQEECSGKKKSKFQTFKKFFARKKRKDPSAAGADAAGLKASQSSDNVSKASENNTLTRSEKEKGSGSKISLGSKALSHDSVFVSDSSEANEVLGASQDSIHGKVKSLQLQLKQAIKLGSPPSLMCVKRTEDAGTMSEDDGLPCSPPEYTTLHTVMNQTQRNSSISLEGIDSDDDQLSCAASSRAVSPLVVPGDFSQPASPFVCLDNSAAKHKLGLRHKACNKRKPASRLEGKPEGDSVMEETLTTSIPETEALEERQQRRIDDVIVDQLKPKVERGDDEEEEDDEEKQKQFRESLLRDKEQREEEEDESPAEQEVSHSPDTSCPPEPTLSEEEASEPRPSSKPSSRASSADSPRATPEPPAAPRGYSLDSLDSPGLSDKAEDNKDESYSASGGEDDDDGVHETREEESSFLQEVLSSLKTPLVSLDVETEGVVVEMKEEEDEEMSEEVKEEEDEPVGHQAAPSTSVLSVQTTEEEKEADTQEEEEEEEEVAAVEEEVKGGEDEEEEEEDLVVEQFNQHDNVEEGDKEEAVEVKSKEEEEEEEDDDDMHTRQPISQAGKQEEEGKSEEEEIEPEKEPEVEEKREDDDYEEVEMNEGNGVEEAEEAMEEENEEAEEMPEMLSDAQNEEVRSATPVQEEDEGVVLEDDATKPIIGEEDGDPTEPCDQELALEQEEQENVNQDSEDEREDGEERAEEDVQVRLMDQKSEQEEDVEAKQLDVDQTEEDREQKGGEIISHLETKEVEKHPAEEQAPVSSKPPSLFLPESHDESHPQDSGAISPSKTSTIHINLVSPSSEKSSFQLPPTAAHPSESVAHDSTEANTASVHEEPSDSVEEPDKRTIQEPEAASPASVEETVNQPPSSLDQSKVRFTIAPAWQRSKSLTPPPSPPASVSSSFALPGPQSEEVEPAAKEEPVVKPEPANEPKAEMVLSPGRVRNTGSVAAKPQNNATPVPVKPQASAAANTEESSVVVEGNPDNPFGVRLRKTSALLRFSSEEENAEPSVESPTQPTSCKVESPPISVKPSLPQPISNKPALPKKPDVTGDSGAKLKRVSDPAAGRSASAGSESPSWISVAKQKQKIYKENSLEEIGVKKEEQERKSSLPMYVSSAASKEQSNKSVESTAKVSPLEFSKPSVEKDTRRPLSPPAPVPPQPSKSQPPPCPVAPKPQLPPTAAKPPPQPAPPQRSAPTPVPVLPKSPSYTSPTPFSKAASPSKTSPVTSPPFSSRTSPEKSATRAPGPSGQTASSQRGLPPSALPQDEPPWMALAKKKAKAWSEMPQIVQ
ncbi:probable serine/threonine-protein kinase kinX isoform X2 [Stegastes partitus]|uniref:Probable serine/threonine-protein kinase kinX isoform X2 n=1 Tax=Stegastes partitus TaxID=144197 RepID=A0A9Y4NNU9_9TELE|nr:PREDICTED: probable serine/threonine-protein kinase kinX isoform X2 [Stegastes partitus]